MMLLNQTQWDGAGVYGSTFHFAIAFFFFSSSALLFFFLWRRGRLDMDESPKLQMMQSDEEEQ